MNDNSKNDNELSIKFAKQKIKKNPVSVVYPLWKAFGGTFLAGSVIKLLQNLLSFANPLILE